MVSTKTKLLLLSGAVGSGHALLVHHHGSTWSRPAARAAVRPATGPTTTTHDGRKAAAAAAARIGSIQRRTHSHLNGDRDLRLFYRRLPSTPAPVDDRHRRRAAQATTARNATTSTSTPIPPPPLPLDFERIGNLDALESIVMQQGESLGGDLFVVDGDDGDLFSSSRTDETAAAAAAAAGKDETSLSTTRVVANNKSETRTMVREIAAIALPSLGGMLLDPIMSLVDTACVGQVSTTALAAMAPCTSIFQFAFFAFFFLSAATTNLVASNPPEAVYDPSSSVEDNAEASRRVDFNERVLSSASALAVVLGSLVTAALFRFSDPLLRLAGVPANNAALLAAARPYLLIRAVGLPFVFLATVLQGGSLGRGDAWRPLRIFGAAGLVNLVGDVWLTLFKGWGATGAATATVAAQVSAALYYACTSARLDGGVEASSRPLRDVRLVWRGLPSRRVVGTFLNVAAALFSRSVGLMMAYSMLTRTAVLGGEVALAAHQVTLQVWWLMSFLPEPMSVAAQTLITRDMKDRRSRVPKLIRTLYQMSGVLGVAAAALTGIILRTPAIAGALVADAAVQRTMATLVPFAMLSQSYCPIGALSDGVCIGLGSFSHLPLIMAGSFLATVAGLTVVAGRGLGVVGVWACMNVFLTSRIAGHVLMSRRLRRYVRKAFGGVDESEGGEGDAAMVTAVPVVA